MSTLPRWPPYSGDHHTQVTTTPRWPSHPGDHQPRWPPYPVDHHTQVTITPRWPPHPGDHHTQVTTIPRWPPYPGDHHTWVMWSLLHLGCRSRQSQLRLLYTLHTLHSFTPPICIAATSIIGPKQSLSDHFLGSRDCTCSAFMTSVHFTLGSAQLWWIPCAGSLQTWPVQQCTL